MSRFPAPDRGLSILWRWQRIRNAALRSTLVVLTILSGWTAASPAASQLVPDRGYLVREYRIDLSLGRQLEVVDLRVEIDLLRSRSDVPFELDLRAADQERPDPIRVRSVERLRSPSSQDAVDETLWAALSFDHRDDRLSVPEVVAVGAWTLAVHLTGQPPDGLVRGANRHGETVLFADHWPNRASSWLPGLHHPSSKARYRWSITAPSRYQVVANGRLVDETDLPGARRLTVWQSLEPLPSKVAVVGVARFSRRLLPGPAEDPSYLWAYPQDADHAFEQFRHVAEIVRELEKALGPRPYRRVDHVQSTTRYGGMENASAIFYSERAVAQSDPIDGLITHELAHQWFGDAVTEASWRDTWLSEGFATFLTLWVTEQREGASAGRAAREQARRAVLRHAAAHPAAVVRPPVEPAENQILNAYTYQKGAWALHMLRRDFGDEIFFELLRQFFDRHRHGIATTEDFLAVVERVASRRLGPKSSERALAQLSIWLFGPGHPRIQGTWSWGEGRLFGQLEQAQDWPPFDVPVTIEWQVNGQVEKRTVQLAGQTKTRFDFETPEPDGDVALDPDVDLLFEALTWRRVSPTP